MTSLLPPNEPHFYVPEIFGPTLQGEGKMVGCTAHFIRFGGCDYECKWCDSMHAVDSSQFKKAPKLTSKEVLEDVWKLNAKWKADWVILTGGNPALFPLTKIVVGLQEMGHKVAVETQGSQWNSWIREVDLVCISPKPPSAGITGAGGVAGGYDNTMRPKLKEFLENLRSTQDFFIKVPILHVPTDLEWALELIDWLSETGFGHVEFFLSVVTLPGDTPEKVLIRTKNIFGALQQYDWRRYNKVRLFPQVHYLLWGHDKGH